MSELIKGDRVRPSVEALEHFRRLSRETRGTVTGIGRTNCILIALDGRKASQSWSRKFWVKSTDALGVVPEHISAFMQEMGRRGGRIGGRKRAENMTADERSSAASKAARARWRTPYRRSSSSSTQREEP